VIKAYPYSILQFRVTQKKRDSFEVEVVIGSDNSGNGETLFSQLMRKELGENIEINFRRLPSISREPSGKLRYFLSEINRS
jgi:hypothetical protein